MFTAAPGLEWFAGDISGWRGEVPLWPFERPQPPGLDCLVGGRPFSVKISCMPAHPMVAPLVTPRNVSVPPHGLGLNKWHSLPGGALCLFLGAAWWDPRTLAAELVPKISGWYIEYHLMMQGRIVRMPDRGFDRCDALDEIIDECPGRDT